MKMLESLISSLRVKWVVGTFIGIAIVVHIAELVAVLGVGVEIVGGYWISLSTSVLATIGLGYGVYWVISSDIPQKREGRIVAWFLAGLIGFLLLNVGFMLSGPGASVFRLLTWTRWASILGGTVGFAIGILEARLIYRELEAERRRIHQEELQRERDRLNQFAGTISHDLRNPLSVIIGRVELAQEAFESEHLDTIQESAYRMEEMIEDMLTLARSGEEIDELEEIALDNLLDSCWGNVATADATLEIETTGTIKGDESRLRQAFENLMRNAIEHSTGGVTIRVGELDDGFFIEDDGPGIPKEEREKVFEVGHTSSEAGTGFGLAIVKEIVEAHGWEIEVVDGTAGGARFEITGVEVVTE